MENIKKEEEKEPLPPDEESKQIMDDIQKEKSEADEKKDAEPKEPEEGDKKPDEGQKKDDKDKAGDEEGEAGEDGEKGKEKPNRTPKTMPLYEHEIAKGKWEKKEKELQSEIENLRKSNEGKSEPAQDEKIKKFAEKHGFEVDFVNDLMALLPKSGNVPEDIASKLKALDDEKEAARQDRMFDEDYDKKIVPLLKDIPEDKRDRAKKLLKTLAFTTTYANTPLDVIWRGCEEFDEFKQKGRKSGESSRGTPHVEGEEKNIMDMSDEEFDKFSDELGKQGKSGAIMRQGKRIR